MSSSAPRAHAMLSACTVHCTRAGLGDELHSHAITNSISMALAKGQHCHSTDMVTELEIMSIYNVCRHTKKGDVEVP